MMDAHTAAWVRAWAWPEPVRRAGIQDLCPCQRYGGRMGDCAHGRHDLCGVTSRRARPQMHLLGPDGRVRYWPGNGPSASGRQDGTGYVSLYAEGCVWCCACECHRAPAANAAPHQAALF